MEKNEFSERDKLAIEIFTAIISRSDICHSADLMTPSSYEERFLHLSRNAYKIADIFRKARMSSFL